MAKRWSVEGIARWVVLLLNGLFFALGLTVLVLSVCGFSYFFHVTSQQSALLESFNLPAFNIVLLVSGSVTVGLSLLGVWAAWRYKLTLLKLYLLSLLAVVSVQVAMGIYLLTLDMGTVRTTWNYESASAQGTRISIQESLGCCGYDSWTDSIGYPLLTPCPYAPTAPIAASSFVPPTTCQKAVQDYVNKWLLPVAIAAIVLAVVELAAIATTAVIIFRAKDRQQKTGFEY